MDTVEELNGTYFYAGKSNLSAAELLFMIFCEKTVEQFGLGISDFVAVVAILSGRNDLPTRPKPIGATEGTSHASKTARAIFKKAQFPYGIQLPTWTRGYTPWTAKRRMVSNIGTFVGRFVPLLGMIIFMADVSEITYRTICDYNAIARGSDKIW